jgi:uncharacterized protein (TIGR02246 family)
LLAQLTDAFNRGDARGASAAFTPNGNLITGDGTLVEDAAEIERFLSELQAKLPKGTQFIATVTDVRFAGPESRRSPTRTRGSNRSSLSGARVPGELCCFSGRVECR